jgi:NAD(P)-dependent dehydrogenase (short-subunit alcohol dehydrogenase family)
VTNSGWDPPAAGPQRKHQVPNVQNLGALIAETLAKQGCNVAIHYNSPGSKKDTDATLAKLKGLGVKAVAIQAELSSAANVKK